MAKQEKQVLIQFRADGVLKQEVSEIYEALGLDLPTALRMFLMKSRMVGGIPFEVRLPDTDEKDTAADGDDPAEND